MLKRIFYILLSVVVLVSSFIIPVSAYVVDSNDASSVFHQAYLDLRANSLNKGISYNVAYLSWNFTKSDTASGISYPFIKSNYSYDPSGYVFYLRVLSSDIFANPNFRLDLATSTGSSYNFTDFSSFTLGLYTYFYKSFSSSDFFSLFQGSLVPNYFNFSSLIYGQGGIFSSIDWGVVGGDSWSNFTSVIDSQSSFNNGFTEGSSILSSPFLSSELSLSYYFQGNWIDIPIYVPDFNDYITATTVNLNILQNLGINSEDIPTNNGGLRLCFTLPYVIDMSAFSFGAFLPSDLVLRYDPADIRSDRYGVWFNNTISDVSLWPLRSISEGNSLMYDYNFPPNRLLYNQICIELNEDSLRSVLTSNSPVSDYISYRLVDFEATYGSGYDAGYDVGYGQGEVTGFNNGKQQGFLEGKAEGLQMADNGDFFSLFSALIDAPVSAFTNLLSFEIFGQNMASFALSILTLLLIIKVVKVVI